MFSSIEGQTNVTQSSMQMQMGFPPQPSPAEQLQAPTSASGRVRRELPQVERVPFFPILLLILF